jgi:LPXTG-motif cell wall-anchored protein
MSFIRTASTLAAVSALTSWILVTGAGNAAAVSTTCASGICTVTFTSTGSAQTWTPPVGVSSATFTLYGAQGGQGIGPTPAGGFGAKVVGTMTVTAGTAYQINVGAAGLINGVATFGGGGAGGGDGGAGGGATDIRFPAQDTSYPLTNRLLVAGGGGGTGLPGSNYDQNAFSFQGVNTPGANAGAAGGAGQTVVADNWQLAGAGGGGAGTATSGGAAGLGGIATSLGTSTCFGDSDPEGPGFAGALGVGGAGGYGPGGGGGYYGGGGSTLGAGEGPSGGNFDPQTCQGTGGEGGAGGGSSYTGTATNASILEAANAVLAPDNDTNSAGMTNGEAIISYLQPQAPAFTTAPALPAATVGASYTTTITDTATPAPTDTVVSGSLPPGLTLHGDPVLSGTPTTAGTYTFTLQSSNVVSSSTRTFTITVAAAALPAATLPATGSDDGLLTALAFGFIAAGAAILYCARRRPALTNLSPYSS